MKPVVKKVVKKVATRKDKDGSQQWESQKFRNSKDVTKDFIPKNKTQEEKMKLAGKLGTASAQAFINTGSMKKRVKTEASYKAKTSHKKKPVGGK